MSTRGVSQLFSLLQAFDQTGQRMFQNEWNGHEAFAKPEDDPAPFQARREEIEKELARLRRQDRALERDLEDNLSREERADIARESEEIWTRRDALNRDLNTLPIVDELWVDDFAGFNRRIQVEDLLRDAFETGDLTLRLMTGRHANYRQWITERHFYISFAQSIVLPPKSARSRFRRCPAYVPKDELEKWLGRFAPDPIMAGELSVEEKCGLWLKEQCSRSKGDKIKNDFLVEAQSLFPGLSRRAFERIWANTVPAEWKQPKRRR